MSEEKKKEALDDLKEALAEVPAEYHEEVSRTLAHEIGIIARTIDMVAKKGA